MPKRNMGFDNLRFGTGLPQEGLAMTIARLTAALEEIRDYRVGFTDAETARTMREMARNALKYVKGD